MNNLLVDLLAYSKRKLLRQHRIHQRTEHRYKLQSYCQDQIADNQGNNGIPLCCLINDTLGQGDHDKSDHRI